MTTDLSPDAELLMLIFASHGGTMSKNAAAVEFIRVLKMDEAERRAWTVSAKEKVRIFSELRGQVDGTLDSH